MMQYGLLGASAQARETAEFALPDVVVFCAVSSQYLDVNRPDLVDIEIVSRTLNMVPVVVAVGAPGLKRRLVRAWNGTRFHSVVSTNAWVSPTANLADGVTVAPFAVISSGATVGAHVLLNIGSSISHDCEIGEFVTISPGVRIGGGCQIGEGVFIGIGATIVHSVAVAAGIVVAAGAVVVDDLAVPGVYAGVPARLLRAEEEWLDAL